MKLKPEEFEHAKTGERQRLKTLHQAQVSLQEHAYSCLYSDLAHWPSRVTLSRPPSLSIMFHTTFNDATPKSHYLVCV